MESDISIRALDFCKYKGITAADFERNVGLANGMLKKLSSSTRNHTFSRISNAFPDLNISWLRTGKGEMLNNHSVISQSGDSNILQKGTAGRDLNQTANSEKLVVEFIDSLKAQSALTARSMSQTDKVIEELSEQRKLMDRLITIIEKK